MDFERELLNRLDAMEKHLFSMQDELIRYRRERFMKSVATFLLVVLPLIGLGFVVPNFVRKYVNQIAPASVRPVLQSYIPVDPDVAATATSIKQPIPPPVVLTPPIVSNPTTIATTTATATATTTK